MKGLSKTVFLMALLCACSVEAVDDAFDFAKISARRFPPASPYADAVCATGLVRRFELPHSNGGMWRLSFNYSLDHSKGDRIFGARVRVTFGPKQMPWGRDVRGFSVADSGTDAKALYPWGRDVEVFPGMEFADIGFDMEGEGVFSVADIRFEEIPRDLYPVSLEMPFGGYFDGAFHIGSGQAGLPVFLWRTNLDKETPPGKFGCRVSLPEGFSFVDSSHADLKTLSVTNHTDGETIAVYRVASGGPAFARTGGTIFGLMIRADAPPGKEGMMSVVAEVDGKAASPPIYLRLASVAQVKAAKIPERYSNAAFLGGAYACFSGAGSRALARTLRDAGVTWLIPGIAQVTNNPALLKMWREEGIRRITPDGSRFVSNGFHAEGKVWCPCELYRRDSPLRKRLKDLFKRSLAGCDGMWSNWEPYAHTGRRTLCEKCAAAEKGLEYPALLRLRSSEHGRVVCAIADDVASVTGRAVGFIPGIYWPELGPGHNGFSFTREIDASAYAGELSMINAFGPYVRCNTSVRYVPEPGRALAYFCVARETMRQLEEDYPPETRPSLMAFPLGLSGRDWASSPKWLELSLLSFFFNAWNCSAPWSFPAGGDARFLAVFARATELAAKWEDFIWNGVRVTRFVKVEARGEVRTRPWIDRTYLPALRDVPLLQYVVWEKSGERIVALFNFDEENSVTCDVSALARTQVMEVPPASCRVAFFPRDKKSL